ncbi:MAG: DUF3109 family protein [Saprospiraceae bacterium]
MLEIQGKLISLDIIEKKFVCNLSRCKGACCVEGDAGAPLNVDEIKWLEKNINNVIPYLDDEGSTIVREKVFEKTSATAFCTPLKKDRACIYSSRNGQGILQCNIEKAYQDGAIDFIKPISCHLYPIRITKEEDQNWEALNYDQWDICSPACRLGAELGIPVYKFLKIALVRKYGVSFYDELDEIANEWIHQYENNNLI